MYAIYIITCKVNAKQYVGITNDLSRRWRRHRNANDSHLLHKAIKKHGVDNFIFTHIADAFDVDSAKLIEQILIAEHNTFSPSGYNLTKGGDGTFGYKHTEESKAQSRESNLKAWSDPELRKRLGEKISLVKKGKPSPKKGKPSGKKGTHQSPDHIAKRMASFQATMAIKKAKQSSESGVEA